MGKIKILADSCCDLTPEQVRQHDITIMPLYVMLGDKVYRDRVDIQPQMIYEHFRKTGATPKTSAANVQDYLDVFRPFVEAGDELIYIGISLGFSCTVTNARLAAAESVDPRLCIHDFRYVEGQTHSNLIFDIAAPFEMKLSDDEIRQKVTAELRKIDPKFNTVITVDRG